MSADNGGWAFPNWTACEGMTLRDYFAARAMPIAEARGSVAYGMPASFEVIAEWSYAIADAMLKARQA